jgi:predicted HicB family RNase H-like nuclease
MNAAGPLKQFNIRLPDQLHRELKAKCALDGIPLVKLVEGLARQYLAGKVKIPKGKV